MNLESLLPAGFLLFALAAIFWLGNPDLEECPVYNGFVLSIGASGIFMMLIGLASYLYALL